MDTKDIRNLQEAYLEVYSSPEELDERLRRFPKDKVWAKQEKIQSTLENNPNLSGERLSNRWSTMDNVRQDMNNPRNPISQHTPPKSRKKSLANKNRPEHEKRSKTVKPRISFPNRLMRSDGQGITDSYDIYDVILSHLLDEGYAETVEAAEVIMVNMSEDWRESIVEEMLDEGEKPLPYGRMMKKSNQLADKGEGKRAAKIYLAANSPKGPKVKVRK